MWWIIGIVSLIIGIVFMNIDDWEWEDLLNPLGLITVFGVGCIIWAFLSLFANPKTEVKAEVLVTDSIQVVPDTIYAIQYVVSYKDENGVWCGNNIKLLGKTEKNIGDTIIVNLK